MRENIADNLRIFDEADDTAKKLLFRVGAHEGLKCGSESGRKGVDCSNPDRS